MSRRFFLMLLAVGVVFGGIFGFEAFVQTQIDAFFDNMPVPTETITATEARAAFWTPEVTAIGTLEPVQGTALSMEIGGIVREISFAPGTRVTEGEVLLRLDTETDVAELQSLRAAAQLAEQELDRARRLEQERSISEAEVQRRQAAAQQARAAVSAQQARINQKNLRAPFDGVLGIRRVNLGQFVAPGTAIVSLQALDTLYVNFTLPERWLGQVMVGQAVEIQVDAFDQAFSGQISVIEPQVRSASRNFEVQALLANPDNQLRPGQFARVRLATGDAERVVQIPQTAVRFNPYGNSVFVLYEDEDAQLRVRERFIITGERRGNLIRVLEGLEPGERIASSGLLKLQNTTPVRITDQAEPVESLTPRPPNA
jgi:membrane fusion protein (multidrug efflux system)